MLFLIFLFTVIWHSLYEQDILNYPFLVKHKTLNSILEFSLVTSVPILFNDTKIISDLTWNIKVN